MSRTRPTKAEIADRVITKERLRELIKPGDTIYTILRHVSKSGMSRDIDIYIKRDDDMMCISRDVDTVTGVSNGLAKDGSLKVPGCGMDMGFHVVDCLAWSLYPDEQKAPGQEFRHRWL